MDKFGDPRCRSPFDEHWNEVSNPHVVEVRVGGADDGRRQSLWDVFVASA